MRLVLEITVLCTSKNFATVICLCLVGLVLAKKSTSSKSKVPNPIEKLTLHVICYIIKVHFSKKKSKLFTYMYLYIPVFQVFSSCVLDENELKKRFGRAIFLIDILNPSSLFLYNT